MPDYPGPDPAEITQLRQDVGLTREQAAHLVSVSEHTFRSWESAPGSARGRRMPAGLWELLRLKTAQKSTKTDESSPKRLD